ncbi:unnamed protein product [Polarella glacialis]|uniref:Uncharacterized protein n=1 Tax=Polarella glacialis TaxID=89957 RepID=A0A813HUP6_POLGL|nr:unnamed protein product [Polarella glacialis]CAE8641459.1 unnamed protein product [Polarella glacialis]CAE8650471.1 unnamed protein product [Polarella glacialis]CAE8741523.1 unnamed protein product [Polarella glacialis]|mmetsp:Transcript_23623/g.42244  ORF Transcript_23623/g.42244 Transcript_23623/m.42244 type:complete len:181 (+) Transcript_23623:56-598(+)
MADVESFPCIVDIDDYTGVGNVSGPMKCGFILKDWPSLWIAVDYYTESNDVWFSCPPRLTRLEAENDTRTLAIKNREEVRERLKQHCVAIGAELDEHLTEEHLLPLFESEVVCIGHLTKTSFGHLTKTEYAGDFGTRVLRFQDQVARSMFTSRRFLDLRLRSPPLSEIVLSYAFPGTSAV